MAVNVLNDIKQEIVSGKLQIFVPQFVGIFKAKINFRHLLLRPAFGVRGTYLL